MLTPDFRVLDAVATPVDEAVEDGANEGWAVGDGGLGARIAVLEAAVAQRAEEWEPDGDEEAPVRFVPHLSPEADHVAEPDPTDEGQDA